MSTIVTPGTRHIIPCDCPQKRVTCTECGCVFDAPPEEFTHLTGGSSDFFAADCPQCSRSTLSHFSKMLCHPLDDGDVPPVDYPVPAPLWVRTAVATCLGVLCAWVLWGCST